MPRVDLPLTELEQYRPDVAEPDDFDGFWGRTLAESRAAGGDLVLERAATMLRTVDVWAVNFPGFAGEPIKAWYLRPDGLNDLLPIFVENVEYGGGQGLHGNRAYLKCLSGGLFGGSMRIFCK